MCPKLHPRGIHVLLYLNHLGPTVSRFSIKAKHAHHQIFFIIPRESIFFLFLYVRLTHKRIYIYIPLLASSFTKRTNHFFLSSISHYKTRNSSSSSPKTKMSGVWVFSTNGVIRLIENPQAESQGSSSSRRKVLVHLPTGEVVSSYSSLEQILTGLGWERYYGGDPDLFQFHKHSSIDLISLPRDFSKFNSVYMYDIVIKNPNVFHVRDM